MTINPWADTRPAKSPEQIAAEVDRELSHIRRTRKPFRGPRAWKSLTPAEQREAVRHG